MLKQSLQHKLMQKLSPQQIQLMKLLQVPTMELEQRIKDEIEENPALEEGAEIEDFDMNNEDQLEDDTLTESEKEIDISDYMDDDTPDYKLYSSNQSADDDDKVIPYSGGKTFFENLLEQISERNLPEEEKELMRLLVGYLDESGYLRRALENIVDDLAFSQNTYIEEVDLQQALVSLQDLDPAGVGARDLKECLLIQLKRKEMDITRFTARKVLENHFEEFTKKHYSKIIKKLEISDEDLKEAIDEIIKLNPKPGNSLQDSLKPNTQIIPDFIVTDDNNELELSMNGRNAPDLKVSKTYSTMMQTYSEGGKQNKTDKEALQFVKQKLDAAKWFIDAIRQRQQTLLFTMQAILDYQKSYFLTGDDTQLKPMILKDIADLVNMDISTISRVANSKYVQTPYGTFSLKHFFSESLSTDSGEEVSTKEVKRILTESIEKEEKKRPLTDEKLTQLLKQKGYNIARRTVAKYREQLNIPVARLRKEL